MLVENPRLVDNNGTPLDRVIGIETEYAVDCLDTGGKADRWATGLLCNKAMRDKGIDEQDEPKNAQYGSDGSREYVDLSHPEYATAEELSFLGLAHRVLRGHVATAEYYRSLFALPVFADNGIADMRLIANTCAPNGSSWGSHRNYLASRALEPSNYIYPLATHHASRIVWSGAGAVTKEKDSDQPQFALSEKAPHIYDLANLGTLFNRPLVNLRDEPQADAYRYRRIHDVSGETIFSAHANALTMAADSIILRACEVGENFTDLELEQPVAAMHAISNDPSLKVSVKLTSGKSITGLQLQTALAEQAITVARQQNNLTPQEETWGEHWINLLDDLTQDPLQCRDRVDWVVKRQLIEKELTRPHYKDQSGYDIAWAKALDYHRLTAGEGAGMKLVRRGFFVDSPSSEYLDTPGTPPTTTRAIIRTRLKELLTTHSADFSMHWWGAEIFTSDESRSVWRRVILQPYDTDPSQVDALVADLQAHGLVSAPAI